MLQWLLSKHYDVTFVYKEEMIKKFFILLVLFFSILNCYPTNRKDSLSLLLKSALQSKDDYVKQKKDKINNIQSLLNIDNLSLQQQYDIYLKLYWEYEKYIADSAVYYMEKNVNIANLLKDNDLQYQSSLLLASIYSTKGFYIESKKILESIDTKTLTNDQLGDYYHTYSKFYSHYGQSNENDPFYARSEEYRDSLLMILPHDSFNYKIEYASKLAYGNEYNTPEAEKYILDLLDELPDTNPERAMAAYLASEIYRRAGDYDRQEIYLMMSAITDIKNCKKDNASMQSLALVYYKKEDINQAFRFMQEAIDDAVSCKVRYRTVEASESYPIINSAYIEKEKKQRLQLQAYLILISIMTFVLILGTLYIYRQVKKLAKTRKELYRSNRALNKLNLDLQKAIDSLQEANHIKEEYIAHFFDLCSTYIDKIEEYRKNLNKLASRNKLEELFKEIKSNAIVEEEIQDLYKNFDTIFLNIYPTFIEDFNALLLPEEQIYPRQGELLNTELRIYALIRLGIKDSVKIASFLRYSLRTVYNYRTKIRNKAAGKREEFENLVEKIGYIHNNHIH